MPIRMNNFCIFDHETSGIDPEKCYPIEIAAKIYNERSLEPIPGAEFVSMCRPPKDHVIDNKVFEITGIRPEAVEAASPVSIVYPKFVEWLLKYNPEGNKWTALVPCGQNISAFDMIIHNRMMAEFCPKIPLDKVFRKRPIDLMDITYMWFSDSKDVQGYSLVEMRKFFGMPIDKAHRALDDVVATGAILMRFIKFHRDLAKVYIPQMKGALKDKND